MLRLFSILQFDTIIKEDYSDQTYIIPKIQHSTYYLKRHDAAGRILTAHYKNKWMSTPGIVIVQSRSTISQPLTQIRRAKKNIKIAPANKCEKCKS